MELAPYCGIDLSPYIEGAKSWERWARLMMGLKVSPYFSIKATHIAFEVVMGDRTNPANVFHCTQVNLNLPGSPSYDPTQPKVWRYNPLTKGMAATVLSYVDDLRALGLSQEECWKVMNRVATVLTALGIQVVSRKTRAPTTRPGHWAGMVAWGDPQGVCVRSTQAKWTKAKEMLADLQAELLQYKSGLVEGLVFKRLESTRGYLVHMQLTYPALTPYLKGLHLKLNSWRPGRNADGLKVGGDLGTI